MNTRWMLLAAGLVGRALGQETLPGYALIPAGTFEMGDHHGFVDPKHGGDEAPIHPVRLDAFYMGTHAVTTREYCEFLNSTLAQQQIEVRKDGVYLVGGNELFCETREATSSSRIGWDGKRFSVLDKRENHPIVCIRWHGAVVYCNWLGAQKRLPLCYDTRTWDCDFNKSGFRLPTEAEWEYAGRGGLHDPYRNFPWGDEPDCAKANWPESKNPFRAGPQPWTTPVGFFNGTLHRKVDFGWPGREDTFQTSDGVNGYGLYDMAGNVWEFVNDWYERNYYAYSPTNNPAGPDRGSIMPDGKSYRGMRGGNWYNGQHGHSRVSNRNPSYYRGPQDPDHPYYHLGFRVVLPVNAESRSVINPTPAQDIRGQGNPPGGGGSRQRQGGGSEVNQRPGGGEGERSLRPVQQQPPRNDATAGPRQPNGSLVLSSPAVKEDGVLPVEFTGDGDGISPPLAWSGAPAGTKSYALIMHHQAPDQIKWYWILYNIPADVKGLSENVKGVGTEGNNSVNRDMGYAPPHSKGPGDKIYILTLYALSAPPHITAAPQEVNREVLLAAMKDKLLASAEFSVTYTRSGNTRDAADERRAGQERPPRDASRQRNIRPRPRQNQ